MKKNANSRIPALRAGRASAVAVAIAMVAACGAEAPESMQNGSSIIVYGSTGSIEEIMNTTVVPEFERTHDVEVTYQGVTSAEALAKVLAQRGRPEASLVIGNDRDITRGFHKDLWVELPSGQIPALDDVVASAVGDQRHSVGLSVAANGIAYNSRILKEKGIDPPTSWLDLFDDRFAHRVVIYDYSLGGTPQYVYMINQALGGKPDDFSPALKALEEHRDKILAFPTETAQWDQLFADGTAWVGPTSSARVGIAKQSGIPLEFAELKEGEAAFRIQAAIPEGAPNEEGGRQFLDFLLQPAQQKLLATTQFYAPVNTVTELDAKTAALVPEVAELVGIDNSLLLRVHDEVSAHWQRIVGE